MRQGQVRHIAGLIWHNGTRHTIQYHNTTEDTALACTNIATTPLAREVNVYYIYAASRQPPVSADATMLPPISPKLVY